MIHRFFFLVFLLSRMILNSPQEELQSFERLLFLVEQAHWFYEDNVREASPELKHFHLKEFTSLSMSCCLHFTSTLTIPGLFYHHMFSLPVFQSCDALKPFLSHVDNIYKDFTTYKGQVPTVGAIILNQSCNKVGF